jgi:hypothetical protein
MKEVAEFTQGGLSSEKNEADGLNLLRHGCIFCCCHTFNFRLINDWCMTALCQHKKEISIFFSGTDSPMSGDEANA